MLILVRSIEAKSFVFFYILYHNYFIKWSGLNFLIKEIYAVQKYQGKQIYHTQKITEWYTVKLDKWHAPSIPFQEDSLNILRQLSGMALPLSGKIPTIFNIAYYIRVIFPFLMIGFELYVILHVSSVLTNHELFESPSERPQGVIS